MEVLLNQRSSLSQQLTMLKIEKINKPENNYDKIIEETEKSVKEIDIRLNESVENSNSDMAYISSLKVQALSTTFKKVKTFTPGQSVEAFCDSLEGLYNIYVKPEVEKYPEMETAFIRNSKASLDKNVYIQYENSGTTTNTWNELKAYLLKAHGSKASIFQFLLKVWDCQLNDSESIITYAGKIDAKMREACIRIKEKFAKEQPGKTLSVEHVFGIISSMLLTESLKIKEPSIYMLISKRLDQLWDPLTIAGEAQLFKDRGIGGNENINFNARYPNTKSVTQNKNAKWKSGKKFQPKAKQTASSENDRKKGICYTAARGKTCTRHNCQYEHPNHLEAAHAISAYTKPEEAIPTSNTFEALDFQ